MDNTIAELKDGREVTLRFLSLDDKDALLAMFSSMSDDALRWALPPYDEKWWTRVENGFANAIPMIAIHDERIVGFILVKT